MKLKGLTPLIQVFDMPASVAFYCGILGFEIIMQSRAGDHFDWAMLKLDGAYLMLNTAYESDNRPKTPDASRQAAHQDTTLYFDCPDLDEAYEYMLSKGIAIERPVIRDYGMRQLSVNDPDGYGLCFQHPVKIK